MAGFCFQVYIQSCWKNVKARNRSLKSKIQNSKPKIWSTLLFDRDLSQQLEIAEHLAGAENHAAKRVIRNGNRQTSLFPNPLIQVLQQCATTCEHNATIADIGRQLRRRAFQRHANRIHDGGDALTESLANLAVIHRNSFWNAFYEVAALYLHGERLFQRICGTDFHLDLLGGALANQQVIFPLQIVHDGFVHLVAGHPHGTRINDAAERNDCDISGSTANVDDHVAAGFGNREACSDCCYHRLFHEVNFAGFGAISRIHHSAFFHLGNFRRHTDHDARVHQHFAVVRLLDEVVQHLFGDFEVSDHSILHWFDGDDIPRRPAQHLFGFFANGLNFTGVLVNGYNRRLIDYDPLAARVHQRVGGAEIDCEVAGEETEQRSQVVRSVGMKTVG